MWPTSSSYPKLSATWESINMRFYVHLGSQNINQKQNCVQIKVHAQPWLSILEWRITLHVARNNAVSTIRYQFSTISTNPTTILSTVFMFVEITLKYMKYVLPCFFFYERIYNRTIWFLQEHGNQNLVNLWNYPGLYLFCSLHTCHVTGGVLLAHKYSVHSGTQLTLARRSTEV